MSKRGVQTAEGRHGFAWSWKRVGEGVVIGVAVGLILWLILSLRGCDSPGTIKLAAKQVVIQAPTITVTRTVTRIETRTIEPAGPPTPTIPIPRPVGFAPADRPTFTWRRTASYVTFNSIIDNPLAGDERPFLAVGDGHSPVVDRIEVHDRQQLILRVFYDNDAAPNLTAIAENTRVKVALPHRAATKTYAAAYITSDNANPRVVADTVNFYGARPFSLSYIPGTAKIWNYAHRGLPLDDSIITESGALIGFSKMDGQIPSDRRSAGWVTLKVLVAMPKI